MYDEGTCPACGEYVENRATCCREEKAKDQNLTPAVKSLIPEAKRSILRRLKVQLENPDLTEAGKVTLERVIAVLEKTKVDK